MIRFIKEPPGMFRSRFKVGETAEVSKAREQILVKEGYAVYEVPKETDQSESRRLLVDDTPISTGQNVPTSNKRGNRPRRRNH